jgi:drug/metabolite transporter (DMT)-like permease
MVVGSGVLFAVNGIVSKLILRAGLDAPRLTELRATGAALGLSVLWLTLPRGRRGRLAVTRRELPLLAGYGLAGFFLVPMLYFVAISRLPVGIALLFEYTAPLFVALWARFGQHQAVRPRLWLGLALSLGGLAAVAEVWHDVRLDGIGVAAGLGAAALLTLYYLLGARGVADRDPLSLTWWAFAVAALAGALTRPWWTFPYRILAGTWPLVLYLVLAGSIASYLLVAAALRHLPTASVGIIGMVEPVIASAVAWPVLDERLDAAQLTGGALIIIGVGLAETARTVGPSTADTGLTTADEPHPEGRTRCIPT